jgi:hypothetical protein
VENVGDLVVVWAPLSLSLTCGVTASRCNVQFTTHLLLQHTLPLLQGETRDADTTRQHHTAVPQHQVQCKLAIIAKLFAHVTMLC